MKVDQIFAGLLDSILTEGREIDTRNSITKRKINLSATFNETPLIQVRTTAWKNALREMEWFLSGSNNIKDLHPSVHSWWTPWADKIGRVANNYSTQFRKFYGNGRTVDQIDYMIETLQAHPNSRRNVITTWNTADMTSTLTPITNCHGTVIQAFVEPDNSLHLTMYQRSADMVLGVPHNWIQYWALLIYLAHRSGRKIGSFTWHGGDCHIYQDHIEMAQKIVNHMNHVIPESSFSTPNLIYTPSGEDFKADDFILDARYDSFFKERLKMTV